MVASRSKRFTVTVEGRPKGRVIVPVGFDPDVEWGVKERHHAAGTIDGKTVRVAIEQIEGRWAFSLGPAWRRDCGVEPGEEVEVVLAPEGPQRGELAPDVAAALDAEPKAGAFFDALAQFYRKGYLRYMTRRSASRSFERNGSQRSSTC